MRESEGVVASRCCDHFGRTGRCRSTQTGQQRDAAGLSTTRYHAARILPRCGCINAVCRLADEKTGFINSISPDLKAFKARGGKLLLYHGWNDFGIAPGNTIDYYSSVLSTLGSRQENWMRLFMVPGMGHCSGGSGPNQAGFMEAMERWREAGESPDQITAYHVSSNRVDITRPLCPYPQVAKYKGIGSTNDAANFVCKAQ
jgi:hypothetical protein